MKKRNGGMIGKIAGLQQRMMAIQKELAEMSFEGFAANNLVKAVVSGHGELERVTFDPSLAEEDLDTLADLVVIATNQAVALKEATSKQRLSGVTAGIMPLGLKIPGL